MWKRRWHQYWRTRNRARRRRWTTLPKSALLRHKPHWNHLIFPCRLGTSSRVVFLFSDSKHEGDCDYTSGWLRKFRRLSLLEFPGKILVLHNNNKIQALNQYYFRFYGVLWGNVSSSFFKNLSAWKFIIIEIKKKNGIITIGKENTPKEPQRLRNPSTIATRKNST